MWLATTFLKIPITWVKRAFLFLVFYKFPIMSGCWIALNASLLSTEMYTCFSFLCCECRSRSLWSISSGPQLFPLPTPAVLFLRTVLEAIEGSSAHVQGRLKMPGNNLFLPLPLHRAQPPLPNDGRSWYLNTLSSPSDGDKSEVWVLRHLLSFPMGWNSGSPHW